MSHDKNIIQNTLQDMRKHLLDLSSRNRLLKYQHSKRHGIRFVDKPNLDVLFDQLVNNRKSIPIRCVPRPQAYEGQRPEVEQYAQSVGIDTDFDFNVSCCSDVKTGDNTEVRALLYPDELEGICKGIRTKAQSALEETGTNMLYLIFGFLEFYESDTSNKPMNAPLLAVPVSLQRGSIDNTTRCYQYSLVYSGEDVNENYTLREKLQQDLTFHLPMYYEEDLPGAYFNEIRDAIRGMKRWNVRCQLTLGFISFARMIIWDDIDPQKHPELLDHEIVKNVLSGCGCSGDSMSLFAEDYEIDKHPQSDLPLIYDADSSQHSAIIDVLSGRNMVINGPPGTGKSQTITNIIAMALRQGKTVLFVSEKLAALEVVSRRLEQAQLGHFCLELHSAATNKQKILKDIEARLNTKFQQPQQLQTKINTLIQHKNTLNRHAALMNRVVGNNLGLSVHDAFWRLERFRRSVGDLSDCVAHMSMPEATAWSPEELDGRRRSLENLGRLFKEIGRFDWGHPWWGFSPGLLISGDDAMIGRGIAETIALAERLSELVRHYQEFIGAPQSHDIKTMETTLTLIDAIPQPPGNCIGSLLPGFFPENDPHGQDSHRVMQEVCSEVLRARALLQQADNDLLPGGDIDIERVPQILSRGEETLAPEALMQDLNWLRMRVSNAVTCLESFTGAMATPVACDAPAQNTAEEIDRLIAAVAPLEVSDIPIKTLNREAQAILRELDALTTVFATIEDIAKRRKLPFDGSQTAIANLANLKDVLVKQIDRETLDKVRGASEYVLSGLSLYDIDAARERLGEIVHEIKQTTDEFQALSLQAGLRFDATPRAIVRICTLAGIAEKAPLDILTSGKAPFGAERFDRILQDARKQQQEILALHRGLDALFYLKPFPDPTQLKDAIRVFRRGDSSFNFLSRQWRQAKRFFKDLAKHKVRHTAEEYARELFRLQTLYERSAAFSNNDEYREVFGGLFKGLGTNFDDIARLHAWFIEGYQELNRHPELIDSVDLAKLTPRTIRRLAAMKGHFDKLAQRLGQCRLEINGIFNEHASRLDTLLRNAGWVKYTEAVQKHIKNLTGIVTFLKGFVSPSVSPKRAFELLSARLELQDSAGELSLLACGTDGIAEAGGQTFRKLPPLAGQSWGVYLRQSWRLAADVEKLCRYLSRLVAIEATPAQVSDFIRMKLALEGALSGLVAPADLSSVTGWEEYLVRTSDITGGVMELVSLLYPIARPDKSLRQVIDAMQRRHEAETILQRIRGNAEVCDLLGDAFNGASTDNDALEATHRWGVAVTEALDRHSRHPGVGQPSFAHVRARLLCAEAPENLQFLMGHIPDVVNTSRAIQDTLADRLRSHGTFTWQIWQEGSNAPDTADGILSRLQRAYECIDSLLPWSRYLAEQARCTEAGLGEFVTLLQGHTLPPDSLGNVFEFVVCRSVTRGICSALPELNSFSGVMHNQTVSEFIRCDRELIALNGEALAYEIDRLKNVPDGTKGDKITEKTELSLICHELPKKKRHLPIRQLIRQAGRAIQALKPCFMMSPLSIAQYIEQGAVEFDLVVMDEASQLRREEALGAIVRGKQLVVVGDPKQLPPTSFFDRVLGDNDDDDDSDTSAVLVGTESILDICQQSFHPVRSLRWHYRSRHESLIAFSNHHFYDGRLVVFPAPFERHEAIGLRNNHLPDGVYLNRRNEPEAERVVDAIIEHMIGHKERSLGVVTLNQPQRELIDGLLDRRLREMEGGESLRGYWENIGAPFFIKNLENVQGDERDVIFISTTFGKVPGTNKVAQRFGPISSGEGWRRLNVLFTRARYRIELFTSMYPEDIVLDAKTPAGARALRDYLEYARSRVLSTAGVNERPPDSDFEIAVGELLRANGYEIVPQLGVAGFFIDIAVRNPDNRGEFLAAIECDGAAYHSSKSARDRDRIRQEILESLGWRGRIWRIWSTDWFYDRRKEAQRLLSFLKECRGRKY
ncbi:MAG: DUF4011 domain-containing protein [Nitrospirae bacterium]|uniref:DUF4011 domain-containing protein n=1 Tax=Candidatus Magnetobacterium casense TaxID=1455061 RepID=UPI000AA0118E|nr:DUF4011 domain-containing protein [Candidatus Magnetobacterium casensis]MBF0338284.1 DUF4011 domain-containing protein [Nitrospirota bacterium]